MKDRGAAWIGGLIIAAGRVRAAPAGGAGAGAAAAGATGEGGLVTPEGRQIVVGPDDGYPAAFPAASPASWSAARERLAARTFYPGICPDIDHRTDTPCYESP